MGFQVKLFFGLILFFLLCPAPVASQIELNNDSVSSTDYFDEQVPEKQEVDNDFLGEFLVVFIIVSVIIGILYRYEVISIPRNFFMGLFAIMTIIMVGLLVFNAYKTSELISQKWMEASTNQLVSAGNSFEMVLHHHIEEGIIQANLVTTHQELSNEELIEIVENNKETVGAIHINSSGFVIKSSNHTFLGMDFSKDDIFLNRKEGIQITPIHNSELYDYNPIFCISKPYNNGVLNMFMGLEVIIEITSNKEGLGATGETVMAFRNSDGDAEFFTPRRFPDEHGSLEIISKDSINIPMTQALLKNEEVFDNFIDYRGEKVLAVTKYIPELDMGIVVKKDIDEIEGDLSKTRNQIWKNTLNILLVFFIVSILFNMFMTQELNKEVKNKTQQLEERTKELENKNKELERFNKIAIDRELRMVELKNKLNKYEE